MSGVNNKNQWVVSISGLLLCVFYVAFIALVATIATSIQWAFSGIEEYEYISGWNSPDIGVVLFDTIIALSLVIPWIYYFLNKRKIDYKLGRGFAVFTISMIVYHFLFFMRIEDMTTLYFRPKYFEVERDVDDNFIMFIMFLLLIGLLIYIPMAVHKMIEIKRNKNNMSCAETIEG